MKISTAFHQNLPSVINENIQNVCIRSWQKVMWHLKPLLSIHTQTYYFNYSHCDSFYVGLYKFVFL